MRALACKSQNKLVDDLYPVSSGRVKGSLSEMWKSLKITYPVTDLCCVGFGSEPLSGHGWYVHTRPGLWHQIGPRSYVDCRTWGFQHRTDCSRCCWSQLHALDYRPHCCHCWRTEGSAKTQVIHTDSHGRDSTDTDTALTQCHSELARNLNLCSKIY